MIDMRELVPHTQCYRCVQYVPVDDGQTLASHSNQRTGQMCLGGGAPVNPRMVRPADPADPGKAFAPDIGVDPTVEFITVEQIGDRHWHEETMARGLKAMETIPVRYRNAVVDVPEVADWVRALIKATDSDQRTFPRIDRGPSLMLLGPTGTGKTFTAYGVVRALSVCGVACSWTLTTAADFYAKLRPRPNVDAEEEFQKFAQASFLVLDDMGAAKGSEWNEEINYRLINHRYENELPTLITSNVPPKNLGAVLGERVASRLVEMAGRVVLKGADRRLNAKGAA